MQHFVLNVPLALHAWLTHGKGSQKGIQGCEWQSWDKLLAGKHKSLPYDTCEVGYVLSHVIMNRRSNEKKNCAVRRFNHAVGRIDARRRIDQRHPSPVNEGKKKFATECEPTRCHRRVLSILGHDSHTRILAPGVSLRIACCQLGFIVLQDLCTPYHNCSARQASKSHSKPQTYRLVQLLLAMYRYSHIH